MIILYANRVRNRRTNISHHFDSLIHNVNHSLVIRHVVELIDHLIVDKDNNQSLYVLMQLAKESLDDYLNREKKISEERAKVIMSQMLSALLFMKKCHHITHRDLKLLLDDNRDVLVADFGLSRVVTLPSDNTKFE